MIKKIKKLMEESEVRPVDIAKHLNIGTNTYSNWFGRGRIPTKYATQLASFFTNILKRRITVAWLLAEDEESSEEIFDITVVPIVGTASCGSREMSVSDGGFANFNSKFWKQSLYCVIANGDSMSPEIDDGDEVIIDADTKPKNGDLALYKIDGEQAIKVFYEDTEAYMIQFIPYNTTEEFKTQTFRLDDEDTLNELTIHKVVGVNKIKTNNRISRLKMIGR